MIDYDLLIIAVSSLLFLMLIGGVILLFPLTRKLGHLIEVKARDPRQGSLADDPAMQRITARLDELEERVATLAERQEFADRLLMDQRPAGTLRQGEGHAGRASPPTGATGPT